VVFAQHNLVKDPPFTNIDMVSCRNLLIYLQPVLQQKALQMFNFSLNPQGILFLGSSETIGEMTEYFAPVNQKYKIFQAKGKPQHPAHPRDIPTAQTRSFPGQVIESGTYRRRYRNQDEGWMINRYLDLLSNHYVPLSVVVNENMEIIHTLGNTEGFFKVPSGSASYEISKMVAKDLAIPLSTGIQKVFRTGEEMTYTNIRLSHIHETSTIRMKIVPFPQKKGQELLAAIFLEELKKEPSNDSEENGTIYNLDEEARQHINDLEQELQFTRENLQATIEELETSNEELQATNEELLASNEELQSTNEELQSTNEELYTVNSEYQNKINELTELNNDVDNLLTNSRIGTLLLDEDLGIRRFSAEIGNVFRIMEKDIDRPITHLAHRLVDCDPVSAINSVLKTNEIFEKDVCTDNGRHYIMRICPYAIGPKTFSGLVVTFVDITELISVRSALKDSRQKSDDIVQNMPAGLFVYKVTDDQKMVLESSNPEAERLTGISASQWGGKDFNDIWPNAAEEGITERYLMVVRDGKPRTFEDVYYKDERVEGAFRVMVYRLPGNRLAVNFEDVTQAKKNQKELEESEQKYRLLYQLLANAEAVGEIGSWRWEIASDTVTWSDELFRIFQRDPATGAPSYAEHPAIYTKEGMTKLDTLVQKALSDGTPYEIELEVHRPDGTVRHCVARGHPERGSDGNIIGLYGSFQDITKRVNIEEKLRKAQQRLNFACDTAGLAWWDWNIITDQVETSPRKAEIIGLAPHQLENDRTFWTTRIHPDDYDRTMQSMHNHLEGHDDRYDVTYRLRDVHNQYVTIRDRGKIVERDSSGKPLRFIGTVMNIDI